LAQDQVETMAALGFDRFAVAGHDRADRGRRLPMPLLLLWGGRSSQGSGYDILAVWRDHAENVAGHAIESGHFLPEEAPEPTYRALRDFFAAAA
jgi:haloacetate dehalogenase